MRQWWVRPAVRLGAALLLPVAVPLIITLLIWAPLLGLFGGAALPLVHVALITAAGLVLYRLASRLLPEQTATWITTGYFAGNALIGPTLGNFTDLCQLPVAVFSLVLGLVARCRWLTLSAALLLPWKYSTFAMTYSIRLSGCFPGRTS